MRAKNEGTKVITGKIRMSYANLFTPRAMVEGQEPKYSLCILIPKSDKDTLNKVKGAIESAKESGKSLWGGKVPANLKTPLRDGDEERADQSEYESHYFINATSKQKPGVVDVALNEVIDSTEVYSGCYGRVSINFYPFNQAGNRGIGCGLQNVQKLSEGESLGGKSRAQDDFDAIEDDDILG
ncbi:DUF2815 family protein [Clostridium tarantellae]|uniref:DUF2815 family protein n=1 Tax=Clostridium tarantellae TaxID=39493 RepID=A0A6I1MR00_9CLOT|nr:DUF2815 family protein [Clostridium tarantellae]MPQ44597.1 DUF2815 family protein [Clostridium tarantellae]